MRWASAIVCVAIFSTIVISISTTTQQSDVPKVIAISFATLKQLRGRKIMAQTIKHMKEVDEDLFVEKKAKIRKIEESSDEEEIGPQLEPLTRLAYEEQVKQSREQKKLLNERNRHDVKREDERRLRDHEELYPRADPGTHARRIEKRKQMKAVAATSLDATDEPDVDVFGDDDVRAQLAKAASKRLEKQKLRQIRDLERDTERSDRIRKRKAVEERNMDTLRTLANRLIISSC